MLILPENCRGLFKKPFGRLFSDFSQLVPELAGKKICAVGDVVTANAVSAGIIPDIAVIDGVTKRNEAVVSSNVYQVQIPSENPAGTITDSLVSALKEAYAKRPAVVLVTGEEDLAVLPAIELLPSGWVILYGQPGEGAVLCAVDDSLKALASDFLTYFSRV